MNTTNQQNNLSQAIQTIKDSINNSQMADFKKSELNVLTDTISDSLNFYYPNSNKTEEQDAKTRTISIANLYKMALKVDFKIPENHPLYNLPIEKIQELLVNDNNEFLFDGIPSSSNPKDYYITKPDNSKCLRFEKGTHTIKGNHTIYASHISQYMEHIDDGFQAIEIKKIV